MPRLPISEFLVEECNAPNEYLRSPTDNYFDPMATFIFAVVAMSGSMMVRRLWEGATIVGKHFYGFSEQETIGDAIRKAVRLPLVYQIDLKHKIESSERFKFPNNPMPKLPDTFMALHIALKKELRISPAPPLNRSAESFRLAKELALSSAAKAKAVSQEDFEAAAKLKAEMARLQEALSASEASDERSIASTREACAASPADPEVALDYLHIVPKAKNGLSSEAAPAKAPEVPSMPTPYNVRGSGEELAKGRPIDIPAPVQEAKPVRRLSHASEKLLEIIEADMQTEKWMAWYRDLRRKDLGKHSAKPSHRPKPTPKGEIPTPEENQDLSSWEREEKEAVKTWEEETRFMIVCKEFEEKVLFSKAARDEVINRDFGRVMFVLVLACAVLAAVEYLWVDWPTGPLYYCKIPYFLAITTFKPFAVPMYYVLTVVAHQSFVEVMFHNSLEHHEPDGSLRYAPLPQSHATFGAMLLVQATYFIWFAAMVATCLVPLVVYCPIFLFPGLILPLVCVYLPSFILDCCLQKLREIQDAKVPAVLKAWLRFEETTLVLKGATTQVIALGLLAVPMINMWKGEYSWDMAVSDIVEPLVDLRIGFKNFEDLFVWPSFTIPRLGYYFATSLGFIAFHGLVLSTRSFFEGFDHFCPLLERGPMNLSRAVFTWVTWRPFITASDLFRTSVSASIEARHNFTKTLYGGWPNVYLGESLGPYVQALATNHSFFLASTIGPFLVARYQPFVKVFPDTNRDQDVITFMSDEKSMAFFSIICRSPHCGERSFQAIVKCTWLQKLDISNVPGTTMKGTTAQLKTLRHLRSLAFANIPQITGTTKDLSELYKLSVLCMGGDKGRIPDIKGDLSDLGKLTRMTNLRLNNMGRRPAVGAGECTREDFYLTGEMSHFSSLSGLKNLVIVGCTGIKGSTKDLSKFKHLEIFRMTGCKQIECELAHFSALVKLKDLWIDNCSDVDSKGSTNGKGITGNLSNLGKLTSLAIFRMSNNPLITGDMECFSKMRGLKQLVIENCNGLEGNPEHLTKLTLLEVLKMKGCAQFACKLKNFSGIVKLRELAIEDCTSMLGTPEVLSKLEHLEVFRMTGCKQINCDFMDFGGLAKLKELSIEGCTGMLVTETKSRSPCILPKLKNLEKLQMEGCTNVVCDLAYFGNLVKLKEFNIAGCTGIQGEPGSLPKHLEALVMTGCSKVDCELKQFSTLTALKKLNLKACEHVKGNLSDLDKLNLLEELNVSGCKHIEGNADTFLQQHRAHFQLKGDQSGIEQPTGVNLNSPPVTPSSLASFVSVASIVSSSAASLKSAAHSVTQKMHVTVQNVWRGHSAAGDIEMGSAGGLPAAGVNGEARACGTMDVEAAAGGDRPSLSMQGSVLSFESNPGGTSLANSSERPSLASSEARGRVESTIRKSVAAFTTGRGRRESPAAPSSPASGGAVGGAVGGGFGEMKDGQSGAAKEATADGGGGVSPLAKARIVKRHELTLAQQRPQVAVAVSGADLTGFLEAPAAQAPQPANKRGASAPLTQVDAVDARNSARHGDFAVISQVTSQDNVDDNVNPLLAEIAPPPGATVRHF